MLAWTLLCVVATLLVAPVRVEADGIPLRAARKPLKNNNGSANLKMLLAEVQTVSSKFEHNLNVARVNAKKAHSSRMTRERRGNVALTWKSTAVWTGQITVGTPPQKLQIYFDTGSSDLTVADSTCWKSKCGTKARYTVSKSSTAVKTSQKTTTNYVDGSTSTGTLIRDNLVAGGLTLKNQAIITSTSLSTTVADLDADGLAGLAWPALGTSGTTSIPFTQLDQGKTNGVFSLALSNTDGVSSIYFGGWQSARLSGSFSFYPVGKSAGSSSNTYWQISNSAPYLNGILAQSTRVNMIFDSGTTLIIAPAAAAKAFWARVLGAKKMDDNFWTFPCAKPPTVAFGFNKQAKQFAVSAETFNLGYLPEDKSRCVGAVITLDLGLGTSWILGDAFLMSWYTTYDAKKARIGIGKLK